MVGKLQRVPLRDVWKHEAMDFTKWLEDNPDVLGDALGINLTSIEREKNAGDFNVDLVAEDESGSPVIIENQLEKSNHDHLGKVLTYLAAIEAKTAVWIVSDPRPEHVKAIAWLNDSSSADFYMLKVEAVRIGDSDPAPLLTRIVGPSTESKHIKAEKDDLVERHSKQREFWRQLLDHARTKTRLHSSVSPGNGYWIGTGAGRSGLGLNYVTPKHKARVELYIDSGDQSVNSAMFRHFANNKDSIESKFGDDLDWQALEGRQACRIAKVVNEYGLQDEDKWSEIQESMVDAMIRLERALRECIDDLPV